MIKVIQTLSYLTSVVLQKKKEDTKGKRANPAPPKNRSIPGGAASSTGMPSQLLPKFEPIILSLLRVSCSQLRLKRLQLRRMGSKIFLDQLLGSFRLF